jgi:transposase
MAYSIDFIKTAVAYKQNGHTFKELRETFGIPSETYYQWKNKLANGYYEVKKGKQERKRKIDREQLRQAVVNKPDAYLYELAELFGCTPQAIFYMLEKMNITLKKRLLPIMKSQK